MTATAPPLTVAQHLRAIRAGSATPPGAALLLGVGVLDVGDGTATFALTPSPQHDNGSGFVHGGVLATLVDFAVASALSHVPAGASASTASLNLTYLRPVPVGGPAVSARAQVVHLGRRSSVVEARVVGDDGVLPVVATATVVVP